MNEQENVINFIGEQFRRLNLRFDKLELDFGDLRGRMMEAEEGVASMTGLINTVGSGVAGLTKRIDRIEWRLDRVERRLDRVEVR